MKVNSLAFQTELIFHKFTGIVFEYEDFIVVKTPTNPTYFWGNLIFFKEPPMEHSLNKWTALFQKNFSSMNLTHMTFAWDTQSGECGEIESYISDGFSLEKSSVMVSDNMLLPEKFNPYLIVRPIVSEKDWNSVLENHVACRGEHFDELPFRKFAARKIADYRLMIQQGRGQWMGAFLGDKLAGDLGIFTENGLGRFQNVGTHPDYRRQGVCSTLLYHVSIVALNELSVQKLVIVADPDYHALKIYESLGFKTVESFSGLCKYNKKVWVT